MPLIIISIIKEIKGDVKGGGFKSHLGLRFFLCPLMVDSCISLYFLDNSNISGIDWLNMGRLVLIYGSIYFPGEGTV